MILAEDIYYENELQENISAEELRKQYNDGIIIWINGSGTAPNGKPGAYRCVLDYMGHVKYMEKQLPGATANQTMLTGAIEAIECVNKPLRIYLIVPTALGFASGFKGKGPNAVLIQQLCEVVKEKQCMLTEVQFINGGDTIKRFVYMCNPDKSKAELPEKQKKEGQNRYKEILYKECIAKVVQVLEAKGVAKELIEEVKNIRP